MQTRLKKKQKTLQELEEGYEKAKKALETEFHASYFPLRTKVTELEHKVRDEKNNVRLAELKHIRENHALWEAYYEAYLRINFAEKANVDLKCTNPDDLNAVDYYFHYSKEELGTVIDFCLAQPNRPRVGKDWDHKTLDNFQFLFRKNSEEETQILRDVKQVNVWRLWTTMIYRGSRGRLSVHLQRRGPPLDNRYGWFIRMAKEHFVKSKENA